MSYMSAYFADHEVLACCGSSNLAGKHEGRESRLSGSHGPGGGGVNYTGGLQEGGPKRIENLVSVTS
jgi:hypothetical protein